MTAFGRAVLGGAFGALITLCLHPASQAYILSEFRRTSPSLVAKAVSLESSSLPRPTNRVAVGIWLLRAAEKLNTGSRLEPKELDSLVKLARATQVIDPENAYWPQMGAVYLAQAGDYQGARLQWERASRCKSWNDEQTRRLVAAHGALRLLTRSDQAWLLGYVYFGRSDAAAQQIQNYARSLVKNTSGSSNKDLLTRYITIRNGSLLRDGSRSIRVGAHGVAMVELATYPPLLLGPTKSIFKRIWIAQTTFTSRLRAVGLPELSDQAESDFKQNDSWTPLIERADPEANVRNLCLGAVSVSALPGALALSFCAAGLTLFIAKSFQLRLAKMRLFPTYGIASFAALFSATVYKVSGSWVSAVAIALCISFVAMGPFVPRKRRTEDLGPLFAFTILSFWLIGLCTFILYSCSSSTASACLLSLLGPMGEYLGDSSMFAAVTGIVLAVMCMTAPAWAVVHKYGTPDLFGIVLQRFGKAGMVGGLILCVMSGPLCVYADSHLRSQLSQIVENEPIYYLFQ